MTDDSTNATRQFAQANWSRRRFLGGGAALSGGLMLGPTLLAGCGGDSKTTASGADQNSGGKTLRISNWPLYMAEGFNAKFEKETGYKVSYKENFQDNEVWFAANKDALAANQDIGADLVIPTNFMTARLINLGWLTKLDHAAIPNMANVRPELIDGAWDPGAVYSMPYFSGFVGMAYNKAETGRKITSVDDLWDPKFKGRVSMFSDMQDGLGMILKSQGIDLTDVTLDQVQAAADLVAEKNQGGQIRRFTGNDFVQDLAKGDVVAAIGWSGDAVQAQADNENIAYVQPEQGCSIWSDNMMIPVGAPNSPAAIEFMNYVYEPENQAQITEYVNYVSPVAGVKPILEKSDPSIANNDLIFPSDQFTAKCFNQVSPPGDEAQVTEVEQAFQDVITG